MVVLLYWVHALRKAFHLRDSRIIWAGGCWALEQHGYSEPLSNMSWRSFGHLLELRGRCNGQAVTYYWWMPALPDRQARRLRRIVNGNRTDAEKKMPSVLANPVL